MSTETIIAIVLLLAVGAMLLSGRRGLRDGGHLLTWGLIFAGVFVGVSAWQGVSNPGLSATSIGPGGEIVLTKEGDGHFYVTADVNNVPVFFLVDTGASQIVLTQDDAARIGLNPDELSYIGRANTANGQVPIAPVRLDSIDIEGSVDFGIRATVNGGEMDTSLLGMAYLERYGTITITGDRLILSR